MIYLNTIDTDKIKQTHDNLITNHIAMCDYFMAHESKTILLRWKTLKWLPLFEIGLQCIVNP